ncbi:Cof-type HAD-IIB family hydrolase [Sphingomonas profundi]|uniref:Cof-type HAD-IIB family hydrolase n=1 Tax=Alterirhizorhabdus profundi TaxID=2681549 RepID=UPI0012E96454|nr:Cof-type HAD-IIB family hydrolase [Sphingomonas profundi]
MSGGSRPRLVISDVDGTLVRSDKSLAEATVEAVERLTAAGVPMTLISARPPSGMYWLAERLQLAGPFGAFNGGVLFKADGTVIERHCLDRDVSERVLALLVEAGITRWAFADGDWLASDDRNPHTGNEVKAANVDPIVTTDFSGRLDRLDKIVGISDDHGLLLRLEKDARAIVGPRATIARSQPYYLDVTAPVANKGDGIAFLARAFGVDLADVLVLGDQANDLPMFARAGRSIAMGQAPDDVRAAADEVSESNDRDGVAVALDRLTQAAV